ncbi:c-type cytochrome [Phenylobacterium kunshanense]|nr:c-type cytochrome [Phenylobacterium kunshanense]
MTDMRCSGALSNAAWALVVLAFAQGGAAHAQAQAVQGDAEAGAELYAAQCKGCHTVSIAPTLRGVADRPIASVGGFGGYSEGLRARSAQKWTAENLDAFLSAPVVFAPGSRMVMAVPDVQARADLIAYIRSLPPPREGR